MRILAIAESFFADHRNGLARVAWDVARALARRSREVTLLCPSGRITATETARIEGVTVTRYPRPRVSAVDPRNPWMHVSAYSAAIRDISRGGRWDVVHCHGIYGMNAAAEVLGDDVPKVLTIHSPAVLEQAWNWTHGALLDCVKLAGLPLISLFERRAIAASTICHSLSWYTRDQIERLYPVALNKPWCVIPHWIDAAWWRTSTKEEARRRLGWSPQVGIILTVRQLKPRYGIDFAIRALAPLLVDGGTAFHIVGDGPERESLESVAMRCGVSSRITFEGGVADDRLRLAYQAADAFVIPSRSLECFGLIALESMAVGLPTVSTRVGALPEILGPVSPDRLVPPEDEQALRAAVQRILSAARAVGAYGDPRLVAYAMARYDEVGCVSSYERLFGDAITAA